MDAVTEGQSTAQTILDAALLVVGEHGLRGATTRAIADRAGVNEVTLFRKFGTKANLIREAIANSFATVAQESIRYTGDIEVDLIRLAQHYHDALTAFGSVARALLTEVPFDPELADAAEGSRHFFDAIADMLARYQDEGKLRPEPAASLIPAFLSPIVIPFLIAGLPHPGAVAEFDARIHVVRFLYGRGNLVPP